MTDKKTNPKLDALLVNFGNDLGHIIDIAAEIGEEGGLNMCQVYDGISHMLAQRLGQLEMIHLEGDLKAENPGALITKTLLTKVMSTVQVNAVHSISMGMNDVLKDGGHYTIDQLKAEVLGAVTRLGKKKLPGDSDDDGGRTFH